MKDEQNPFQRSRYKQKEKRRKTNIILNSLIGVVVLLIVIVSVQIFSTDEQTVGTTEDKVENVTTENKSKTSEDNSKADKSSDKKDQQDDRDAAAPDDKEEKIENENKEDTEEGKEEEDKKSEDGAIVTEGGNDPNVERTVTNPEWEPVGTVQTGEHRSTYSGVDWDEMVQAISYATGVDQGNMTIHFLGNNGPNKSVGTIQAKDTKQKYRVYIEWVDEKGWMPTLVEELKS